jgi:hypothetical protein
MAGNACDSCLYKQLSQGPADAFQWVLLKDPRIMSSTTANTEHLRGVEIVADTDVVSQLYGIDNVHKKKIEKFYLRAQDPKAEKALIKQLRSLVISHPGIPIYRNFLGTLLERTGRKKEAIDLLYETYELFPDYVYVNVSLANHMILSDQPEKALKYIGTELRLGDRFKPRKTFHVREAELFEYACINYLLAAGRVEEAVERSLVLDSFFLDEDIMVAIKMMVIEAAMKAGIPLPMPDEDEDEAYDRHPGLDKLELTQPCVRWLFKCDLHMPPSMLSYILDRPREDLVMDLAEVLQHGERHEEVYRAMQLSGYLESTDTAFMVHAMMLLGELHGRTSLETVLGTLARNRDFHELYFGDLLPDVLWEPVAKLAGAGLDALERFMLSPVPYDIAKMVVADAARIHAEHVPAALPEVEQWYRRLLEKALADEDLLERIVVNVLVGQAVDLRFKKLLPLIEALYTASRIDPSDTGTIEHMREELEQPHVPYFTRILPLEERYADLALYEEDEAYPQMDVDEPVLRPFVHAVPKTGRNDPCPCGSGKKHKKCCMD